jgi:hypothetical protein
MLMAHAGAKVSVSEICNYLGGCPTDGIGESTVLEIAQHFGFKNSQWATDDEHLTRVKANIAGVFARSLALQA